MLKRLIALKKSSKIDCNDFFTNKEHPTLHITFKLIYIYIYIYSFKIPFT